MNFKDLAKSGFLPLIEEAIETLKKQEIGSVKFETNLGKVAYDLGKSDGRLEGYDLLLNYINSKCTQSS